MVVRAHNLVSVTCRFYQRLSLLFYFAYSEMEGIFFMEKTSVTLSVYYDGQFFTALFERSDELGFSAARSLFAAKPSDNEILDLILKCYGTIRFSRPAEDSGIKPLAANPKRRQREVAKTAKTVAMSTKAQEALKAEHEQNKAVSKDVGRQKQRQKDDEKFAQRQQKRKQKHKGR
jgi:hypothetical protein